MNSKNENAEKTTSLRRMRSTSLITNFENGYAESWAFSLPKSFQAALDIRYTPRVKNKITTNILTQGDGYSFLSGDKIYDSKMAYELNWGEALRYIKYAISISHAIPKKDSSNELSLEIDSLELPFPEDSPFKDGEVVFDLLINDGHSLQKYKEFTVTQVEFVRFLRDGVTITKDLETFNLNNYHKEKI